MLLLANACPAPGPLPSPGVGVCTLSTTRQALPVSDPTIASKVHQTLDIHPNFTAAITFNYDATIYNLADRSNIIISEIITATIVFDVCPVKNLAGRGTPYTMDIG
jgi:hypothetical protein